MEIRICSGCHRELKIIDFGDIVNKKYKTCIRCRNKNEKYGNKNKDDLKEYYKQYRTKNKKRTKEYSKQYRETNKEKISTKKKKYYKNNRHKKEEYYIKNRDKILNNKKIYYIQNKEIVLMKRKIYHQTLMGQIVSLNSNSKRRMLKNGQEIIVKEWLDIMKINNWKCIYCDIKLDEKNRTIDHLIPLSRDGQHIKSNLIPSCRSCNCSKGPKLLLEWYKFKNFTKEKQDLLLKLEDIIKNKK